MDDPAGRCVVTNDYPKYVMNMSVKSSASNMAKSQKKEQKDIECKPPYSHWFA